MNKKTLTKKEKENLTKALPICCMIILLVLIPIISTVLDTATTETGVNINVYNKTSDVSKDATPKQKLNNKQGE